MSWVPWIVGSGLIAFFAIVATTNAAWAVRLHVQRRPAPSVVPFLGGVAGLIGMLVLPLPALAPWAWVPLVLDYGCVPVLLVSAWLWRRHRGNPPGGHAAGTAVLLVLLAAGPAREATAGGRDAGASPLPLRAGYPEGVVVAGDVVVVANPGEACLALLDTRTSASRSIGGFSTAAPGFVRPSDAAVVADRVFGVDAHARRVVAFGWPSGAPLAEWSMEPADDLREPIALEAAPGGRLLLLDAGNSNIRVLDAGTGRWMGTIGRHGRGQDGMSCPHDLVVTRRGVIAVADAGNRRIQRFGLDGTALGPFGGYGDGPGQFRDPTGIAELPDGNWVIVDHFAHRLQVFTPEGEEDESRRVTFPESLRYPARIAVDAAGQCIVSHPQLGVVSRCPCP